jgi:NAD+ kinase
MANVKLIIFGDPKRRYTTEAVQDFLQFAEGKAQILANCFDGSCSIETLKGADFAVVFGGDGTILSAARELCETSVPVIGVNVGKLGFLAEFGPGELKELFSRIIKDESLIEKRMILDCRVEKAGVEQFSSTAVNDVIIAAGAPFNMIELQMNVQGQALAGCTGDGVIISTPTGSTAYNLSAGGPILSANLSAIVITPICPHSLSFRPIVIDADSVVEIRPVRVNEGTKVTLDGQVHRKLEVGEVVSVRRHRGSFLVVNNPMRTQWDTLASKLSWAGKPSYNVKQDKSEN